jgi:uncharacterized protein (DUF433 family)
MASGTGYAHIVLDPQGVPVITGTSLKVKELVAERLAWGWSPEELGVSHPELTLGQIFSALAYYADHQDELEASIGADADLMDTLRQAAGPSPLVERLRALGQGWWPPAPG